MIKSKMFNSKEFNDSISPEISIPEWKITADIPEEKIAEGLKLLANGYRTRKVAVHLQIPIHTIKRIK